MRIHYACFDAFPSSKGASTHIHHTLLGLEELCGRLDVFCLRGAKPYETEFSEKVNIHNFFYKNQEYNYLKRAYLFSEKVFQCMENIREQGVGQFRDIWGGLAMINRPNLKTVFEVNALTSVELPVRYPLLTDGFINELRKLENMCLQACGHIVTPSRITKNYLTGNYSVPESKITVIPNGAELINRYEPVQGLPKEYIVYFGALQPWQGLDIVLKSFKFLKDYPWLRLVICSSVKEKAAKSYLKLIDNLGLQENVLFLHELEKDKLYYVINHAKASIVPLKFGERNTVQGCCPIKILESMACKTPLVVSDLPVTRELLTDQQAYFFWPEDEMDLNRCIRYVLDNPEKAEEKAAQAYSLLKNQFTWEHHNKKLQEVYQSLK